MTKIIFGGLLLLLVTTGTMGCVASVYVPTPPPTAIVEVRPAIPFPEAIWIDGYWAHRHGNWVWVHGTWERRPWPEAVWISGHWQDTPKGWRWIPGRWRR
jgi:hypothetical protein